jgi:serine/threonine-protein kinase
LTHPVAAAPIATGTDGLVAYLAQEYVPADSLDVVLRDEGPSLPADALRVTAQLAALLDFAAAQQVYHGALHPRDVLIAQQDTRLTGLGVAGAIEKIGVAAPRRRPYAAPERMAGGAWDRRADVFSLAALVHELLWGRRLTAIGGEAADALTDLPGGDLLRLQDAFACALAFDPVDRFETAADFAAAIARAFPDIRITTESPASVRPRTDATVQVQEGRSDENEDGEATVQLKPYTWDEDATLTMTLDTRDEDPTSGSNRDGDDDVTAGLESDADDNGDRASPDARLPFEPDLRDGLGMDGRSRQQSMVEDRLNTVGPEDADAAHVLETVGEPHDVELRAGAAARYDDMETAPAPALESEDDRADPTVAASALRLPMFQQADSPRRVEAPDDWREPVQSLKGPLAVALILGLAVGFAGGYVLGGRSATPAVTSAPGAATAPAAPATSANAAAPPGREFTEAAVGAANPVPPTPGASATPATRSGPGVVRPEPAGEKGTPGAAAVTAPGRLIVRSTPAGARVFVDGREQGQTPATIRDLAPGTHQVRITRDGYVAEERRLAITTAQPSPSLSVVLKRTAPVASPAAPADVGTSTGTLTVLSRPDGARVFLDDQLVGTTPLTLPQVGAGQHAVRLEREGYRSWSSSIRMAGGQRQRVAASLDR